MERADCIALDRTDSLAPLRDQFELPDGVIYLDGNSLGVLPRATAARVADVVQREWGVGLIRSWNNAGWITLAQRVGDKIAQLIGAGPGEVVVADSTSLNLYKVLSVALELARAKAPGRMRIVTECDNFPTDLYIAQSLAQRHGCQLVPVDASRNTWTDALDERCAVLMLTQVHYRTGRLHDMAALTGRAHRAGALTVWDLAHSTGALPVDLTGADADFAIGCGYKYLNGGPGAPAYVWVHPRWVDRAAQPLTGWLGHAAPFSFDGDYRPAGGIARYQCGTPPVLSLAALECGVDTLLAAGNPGGLAALRAKSLALSRLFIARVDARCAGHGLTLASPREDTRRGSHVSYACANGGHAVMQALIERGVIGDFRTGVQGSDDLLRFGFAPLYTRHVDVWDAVEVLGDVLDSGVWRDPRLSRKGVVT